MDPLYDQSRPQGGDAHNVQQYTDSGTADTPMLTSGFNDSEDVILRYGTMTPDQVNAGNTYAAGGSEKITPLHSSLYPAFPSWNGNAVAEKGQPEHDPNLMNGGPVGGSTTAGTGVFTPTGYNPTGPFFPAAELLLTDLVPEVFLRQSPIYDYDYSKHGHTFLLNFTAVEIITFLPRLFEQTSMATRLVNNGMQNKVHAKILEEHRYHQGSGCTDFYVAGIGARYLDAMRGPGWRARPKAEQDAMWTRKKQKVPDAAVWNAADISMNSFIPDRIKYGTHDVQPPSVPFLQLLRGVKKIPQGDDAADLTRAIEFVVDSELAGGDQWIFPDHLGMILAAIGSTPIHNEHLDREIVQRYTTKRSEKAKAHLTKPEPLQPRQSTINVMDPAVNMFAAWQYNSSTTGYPHPVDNHACQVNSTYAPNAHQPTGANELHHDHMPGTGPPCAFQETRNMQRKLGPAAQAAAKYDPVLMGSTEPSFAADNFEFQLTSGLDGMDLSDTTLQSFQYTPLTAEEMHGHDPESLLRNCEEPGHPHENSDFAQAVRYARREDQRHFDWRIRDIRLIMDDIWVESVCTNDT